MIVRNVCGTLIIALHFHISMSLPEETNDARLPNSISNIGIGQLPYDVEHRRHFRALTSSRDVPKSGSPCTTKDGLAGICRSIQNCSFAIESFYRIPITVCAWKGLVPVVCCPKRPESFVNLLTSSSGSVSHQSKPVTGNFLSISVRPLMVTRPGTSQTSTGHPALPSAGAFYSVAPNRSPTAPVGQAEKPKPHQGFGIQHGNGTFLFSLRTPVKMPSVAKQRCGIPSYSTVQRRRRTDGQRVRLNSKDPDTLLHDTASIVGGTAAAVGSFPWMVAISKMTYIGSGVRTNFVCAGSIIDERNVVTAAHCFDKSDHPSVFNVRVGSSYDPTLLGGSGQYNVEKIIFHPDYRPPQVYHDLAIIRLSRSLAPDHLLPLCLPDALMFNLNLTDMEGTIIGWGSTGIGQPTSTGLQQVTVPLVSNEDCDKAYATVLGMSVYFPLGISSALLCAGYEDGGKDACQGDSGGPLMILDEEGRWTLIGIVSVGRGCAEPGFPGLYTRITNYVAWIKNLTEF